MYTVRFKILQMFVYCVLKRKVYYIPNVIILERILHKIFLFTNECSLIKVIGTRSQRS